MNDWIIKTRNLIVHDNLEEVFKLLGDVIQEDSPLMNDLIMLKSRYYEIKKRSALGVSSFDEENITKNRLRASLLGIIEDIKIEDVKKSEITHEEEDVNYEIVKEPQKSKLKVFVSYAHKDESFRKDLEIYLSLLKRQEIIEIWTDRQILAGSSWETEISDNLESADLIIPLISPDFIASDYCYEIEMARAIEKHDIQQSLIVPIVIRPCAWKNSPFVNFQALPFEGKPISSWNDKDEAWLNVYEGIKNVCTNFIQQRSISNDVLKSIKPAIKKITKKTERFKVGVFGETGAGKSTLCNTMLGQDVMRVSDITAVTRTTQRVVFNLGHYELELIDCPGIGESVEEDKRISGIYTPLFKEVDFILWVLRADVRNYSCDQSFIEEIKQLDLDENKKFFIILNMVDRLGDMVEWNEEENRPNKNQLYLIDRKIMYVSGLFRIPPNRIMAMSGLRGYNVEYGLKEVINEIKNAAANKG